MLLPVCLGAAHVLGVVAVTRTLGSARVLGADAVTRVLGSARVLGSVAVTRVLEFHPVRVIPTRWVMPSRLGPSHTLGYALALDDAHTQLKNFRHAPGKTQGGHRQGSCFTPDAI